MSRTTAPDSARIFVQIASYRDSECQWTVKDLFEKADHPERVFVGICWQFDPEEDKHCFTVPPPRPQHVRRRDMHWRDSKGAGWARNEAQKLCEGEEYTLAIDGHMRFVKGWDSLLIDSAARCPSERVVISTVLPGYRPPDQLQAIEGKVTYLHVNRLGEPGAPQPLHLHGGLRDAAMVTAPMPSAFISGNFVFAETDIFEEVPTDPYLYFYCDELCYSARLFTHGIDIFQPDRVVLYHQWDRSATRQNQTYRTFNGPLNARTRARADHLLGLAVSHDKEAVKELARYGLGKKRALADFWEFAGVDLRNHTLSETARKGRWTQWKPPATPRKAPAPRRALSPDAARIFVQIASYRDSECQWTVKDLFEKADHPERIFAGICWQFDQEEDKDCFTIPPPRPLQVRRRDVHWRDSKGAGWARHAAGQLRQGEEYTLQIDSHMRFAKGWDSMLIETLAQCPSERALLSTSLPAYLPPGDLQECSGQITYTHVSHFAEPGIPHLHLHGGIMPNDKPAPFPTPFVIGNFVFGESSAFEEVPVDPYIYFKGYELSQSARFWTHGYDIFQPDRVIAYHYWEVREDARRKQSYKDISPNDGARRSYARVNHVLGFARTEDAETLRELPRYGLGLERSLASFWEFAGVDFATRTVEEKAQLGEWKHGVQRRASPSSVERIFVQIASYRDPECQWTVKDMFEKADNPDRVFAGICWQFDPEEDQDCFKVETRPAQVRTMKTNARDSLGVCWARNLTQKLWQGEEYTLVIDSHMRFIPGWDTALIAELKQCPDPAKAVLTCYPASYTPPDNLEPNPKCTIQRAHFFDAQGDLRFRGEFLDRAPERPLRGAFLAAGFMFSRAEVIREVPYDPYIYFNLEEISLAIRLFTHGWDVYHPTRVFLYHYYNMPKNEVRRRLHWQDNPGWGKMQDRSRARFYHMVGIAPSSDPEVTQELDTYGLGNTRSLAEYERFCGVTFKTKEVSERALRCLFIEGLSACKEKPVHIPEIDDNPTPPPSHVSVKEPPATTGNTMTNQKTAHKPRKVFESPEAVVYDDFLPEETYEKIYDYACCTDYEHINTKSKVARVWRVRDGFPLRSTMNLFYFADEEQRPQADWAYPTNTTLDLFAAHMNVFMPQVQGFCGKPKTDWDRYSVTSWIYPQGTALSLHDDGSGVYSGAYVYFLTPEWDIHWGGLLMLLDPAANKKLKDFKKQSDALHYYRRKWANPADENSQIWDPGLATTIFPKRNRIVFINNEAYHFVTKITSDAGDRVRMSLAGFFHKPGKG